METKFYVLIGILAILYLYYRTLPMGVNRLRKYRKRKKKKAGDEVVKENPIDDKLKEIEPPVKPPLYDGNDADESQVSLDDKTIRQRKERATTMDSVWTADDTTPDTLSASEYPPLPKHEENNDMLPQVADQTVRVIKIAPSKATAPVGKRRQVMDPSGWTTVERVAYESVPSAPKTREEPVLTKRQRQELQKKEQEREHKRIVEEDRLKRLNAHRLSQMKAMFG
jgi:hypothetical protein